MNDVLMIVTAVSVVCLFAIVGAVVGWLAAERYLALLTYEPHEFEELFESNPHPELFDENGELDRGQYFVINFPPDFDPEKDSFFIDEGEDD